MNTTTSFDNACSIARTKIKEIGQYVIELKNSLQQTEQSQREDRGEMVANITLAYRHLEDAAMRMGKAIQAYEGGTSIYDQNDAKRAAAGTLEEKDQAQG